MARGQIIRFPNRRQRLWRAVRTPVTLILLVAVFAVLALGRLDYLPSSEDGDALPTVLRGGSAWGGTGFSVSPSASGGFDASDPGARILRGKVTHVRDGDTIEVAQVPVRLAEIDCAELGSLQGDRARTRMRALAGGRQVHCTLTGRMSYDRQIGTCTLSGGLDLSTVLVRDGVCKWR